MFYLFPLDLPRPKRLGKTCPSKETVLIPTKGARMLTFRVLSVRIKNAHEVGLYGLLAVS